VIRRRCGNDVSRDLQLLQCDWPDLVMIDGGKGAIICCRGLARDEFNEPAVVSRQAAKRFSCPVNLPTPNRSRASGVQLLRRLRDEAHRFAVSFHRQQRQAAALTLDEIRGWDTTGAARLTTSAKPRQSS